ncbi:hypothetical protein [Abyssisolibacter fermentans]|uniref:hypothetical protein n=1 Tax=Abyssisolibacter fermentans TaxID=1766203 RepID=UPI0008335606|nr:hypothetical protein [Abyssisolibacter fermentans]
MYIYIVSGGIICFIIGLVILIINSGGEKEELENFNDFVTMNDKETTDNNTIVLNEIVGQLNQIIEMNNLNDNIDTKEVEEDIVEDIDTIKNNIDYKEVEKQQFTENSRTQLTEAEEIAKYYLDGMSVVHIAKKMNKGIREIEIILKLKNLY